MLRPALISIFLLSLLRPVDGAGPPEDLQVLRALMAERLVVMRQVAAFKWSEGLAIEDKDREARILEETIARVGRASIDPELMEGVIAAQIEAAKIVQQSLFQRWSATGGSMPGKISDLEISLRPRISCLSSEFITVFVAAHDDLDGCLAETILSPVPEELADFPGAWTVAIEGILSVSEPCPVDRQ